MRKRRPMARALSLLLSLILALSLLPGAALAAETDNSRVYSPEEVDSVLGQAVRGGALTDENKAYDLNGDGKLTTWDAKKMLDALTPELGPAPSGSRRCGSSKGTRIKVPMPAPTGWT